MIGLEIKMKKKNQIDYNLIIQRLKLQYLYLTTFYLTTIQIYFNRII